jgi:hypothetical protein
MKIPKSVMKAEIAIRTKFNSGQPAHLKLSLKPKRILKETLKGLRHGR